MLYGVYKSWYSNLKNQEPVGDCLQEIIPGDLDSRARKLSKTFSRAINRTNFKVAISTDWKSCKAHINQLELEAAILAVRHMQRSPASRGHGMCSGFRPCDGERTRQSTWFFHLRTYVNTRTT